MWLFSESKLRTKFDTIEHKLPEGQKSYSKTRPIQKSEFASLKEWWNKRTENEQAWWVPVERIAENGWNLDIKNPFVKEEEVTHSTAELLDMLGSSFKKSDVLIEELKKELKWIPWWKIEVCPRFTSLSSWWFPALVFDLPWACSQWFLKKDFFLLRRGLFSGRFVRGVL